VRNLIFQLFEPLWRFLTPATGRHRLVERPRCRPPYRPVFRCRRVVVCRVAVPFAPGYFPALRDASGVPVRSRAQVSYERWERVDRRLQRQRRRELWLASYGVDAGPRVIQIHGMAVAR
jgi:hypothetical protein